MIHLEKHRSRLRVIENEFRRAEKLQQRCYEEEAEARYLVHQDRFGKIEHYRRIEDIERRKERGKIQLELARLEREVLGQGHLYYGNGAFAKSMMENSQERESESCATSGSCASTKSMLSSEKNEDEGNTP